MEAIKNEAPEQENNTVVAELLLVLAEVNNEKHEVRFGTKTNEDVLLEMCKQDPKSWEVFKNVIFETLDKIETASGCYALNEENTEVIRIK